MNSCCHPACPVCGPNIPTNLSPTEIEESLEVIRSFSNEVYIGTEAFADMKILPHVLQSCRAKGLKPVLLTSGQFIHSIENFETIFNNLLNYTSFQLLLVLDELHFHTMGHDGLRNLLKTIKKCTFSIPEMLYLLHKNETIPPSLLDDDEVNKFLTIHCRTADSLLSYLTIPRPLILSYRQQLVMEKKGTELGCELAPNLPSSYEDWSKDYPLKFNALVIETTYLCNSRCSHCYLSCGPDVSHKRQPIAKVKKLLDEAALLPNLKKHCHVGGGEATIFWDEMIEILKYAKDKGFKNSIVTNGFWGSNLDEAMSKALQLKEAGVLEVELSVDAMHQEFIPSIAISNIIQAAKRVDIWVILRVCTTKEHRASDLLKKLSIDDQRCITIAISKVVPVGRPRETIPLENLWLDPGIPVGACYQVLNLNVTPNGDVFPCCTGSELCSSLKLGNCFEQSLPDIMKSLRWIFLVRTLVQAGPAYFAALIEQAGMGDKLLYSYSNYCHLCNQIFTNPELAKFVRQKVDEKVLDILRNAAGLMSELQPTSYHSLIKI